MKTKLLLFVLGILLIFSGCTEKKNTEVSEMMEYTGIVSASGGNPYFFTLETDGESYGFVINDETELIWEDETALDIYKPLTREDEFNVFGCDMYVTVKAGNKAKSADEYIDVDEWLVADEITVTGINEDYFAVDYKPVIYLYPEEEIDVSVKLDYNGNLFCTYPSYNNGWKVTAQPDGTLIDEKGMEYNYLYWEGISDVEYDFSEGFCVKGEDTAEFLEWALDEIGLNRKEANEFIVFWLPKMQENKYNIISFQTKAYTDNAKLDIVPSPDTLIRVFMAYKPSDTLINISEQILSRPERNGFTVIEWGGTEVK